MNRVKRDYCSKNYHPRWKAWGAKYDMNNIMWPWIGNFCIYCNAEISDVISTKQVKKVNAVFLENRTKLRRSIIRKCAEGRLSLPSYLETTINR
jgi:hypothetical protein